jgi:hypothetical protein
MKTEVKTYEEMEAFVKPLLEEKKFVINVNKLANDAGFSIQWMEHKNYTAHDGKEFPDEIWMDVKGEVHLVQDLEPEHARNILRMILRQERESKDALNNLADHIAEAIERGKLAEMLGIDDEVDEGDEVPPETHVSTSTGKILH